MPGWVLPLAALWGSRGYRRCARAAEASVTRGFIADEQPALWLLQNELLALVSVPEVEVWL